MVRSLEVRHTCWLARFTVIVDVYALTPKKSSRTWRVCNEQLEVFEDHNAHKPHSSAVAKAVAEQSQSSSRSLAPLVFLLEAFLSHLSPKHSRYMYLGIHRAAHRLDRVRQQLRTNWWCHRTTDLSQRIRAQVPCPVPHGHVRGRGRYLYDFGGRIHEHCADSE